MTNDGTQVDTEELTTYGERAKHRAEDLDAATTTVTNVHLGVDMLGLVALPFVNRVVGEQAGLKDRLDAMVKALADDSEIAHTNAGVHTGNEAQQADRFKRTGP